MLFVLVLVPLWTSYLVRVYAWRLILAHDGILNWTLHKLGFAGVDIALLELGDVGRLQLPVAAVHDPAGLGRVRARARVVPRGVRDLGARGWTTFRRVLLPMALPGVVAGSIFTFSLTLGDFITPTLVGGAGSDFIGNVVYRTVGDRERRAVRRGVRDDPAARDGRLSARRAQARRVRGAVMETRVARIALDLGRR